MATPLRIRAGIVPYGVTRREEILFLLGKEIYGKWGPFAGTVEKNEKIIDAALREFREEVMGFFSEEEIRPLVREDLHLIIKGTDQISHIYLVEVDFDPNLPSYFTNVTNFFLRCATEKDQWGVPVILSCPSGYFEKSRISWFSLDELKEINPSKPNTYFSRNTNKIIQKIIDLNWRSII